MSTKIKVYENNKVSEIDERVLKNFDIKKRLGKGAYGIVWKAINKTNNQTVAVKKIFDAFRNETDAQRTFREIMFLREFRKHPNIVKLFSVHRASNNMDIYLSFEYMESDLHNVIKRGTILKDIHRRYIMYQVLNALKYIHSGNVIHRDLKPSNILIDSKCRCKIADFGLARSISNKHKNNNSNNTSTVTNFDCPEQILTDYVATRWYRAPEILIASKKYTKGIDMWSVGCILGEMVRGKPLFPGSSTINQIERIVSALPEPTEQDVKAVGLSFGTVLLNQQISKSSPKLDDLIFGSPDDAKQLIRNLLLFNPHSRFTAKQAICHKYVEKFRHTNPEIELQFDILPPFRDDIQLSVPEYRSKVYEIVETDEINNNCKTSDKRSTTQNVKIEDTINVTSMNSGNTKKISLLQKYTNNNIEKKILDKSHQQQQNSKNFLPQNNNVPNSSSSTNAININKIIRNLSESYTTTNSNNNNNNGNDNKNYTTITSSNQCIKFNTTSSPSLHPKIKYCKISNIIETKVNNNNNLSSSSTSQSLQNHNNNNIKKDDNNLNYNSLNGSKKYLQKLNVVTNNNNVTTEKRHSIDCGTSINEYLLNRNSNNNRQQIITTPITTTTTTTNNNNNNKPINYSTSYLNLSKNAKIENHKKIQQQTITTPYNNFKNPHPQQQQQRLQSSQQQQHFQQSRKISPLLNNNNNINNHHHHDTNSHCHNNDNKKIECNNNNNANYNNLLQKISPSKKKSKFVNNHQYVYHNNDNLISSYEAGDFYYEKRLKNLEDKIQQQKTDIKQLSTKISQQNLIQTKDKQQYQQQHQQQQHQTNILKILKGKHNDNKLNFSSLYSNSAKKITDNNNHKKKTIHLLRTKSENSSSTTTNGIRNNIGIIKQTSITSPINKYDYTYSEGEIYCNNNINNNKTIKKKGIINDFSVITAKELYDLKKSQVIT